MAICLNIHEKQHHDSEPKRREQVWHSDFARTQSYDLCTPSIAVVQLNRDCGVYAHLRTIYRASV